MQLTVKTNTRTEMVDITNQVQCVENSRLVLGTWQGIFFCEFDGPRTRKLQLTIIPQKA